MFRPAILGIAGPALSPDEAALFRDAPPLGVILFARNVEGPAQLADLTAAIRETIGAHARLLVDQEGGRVARLRPPAFRAHPPAGRIAALAAHAPEAAARAAFLTGALIGLDCAGVGIDTVAAPVLDLAVPGASDVVGDRSFGADPAQVATLAGALADGLCATGRQPIGKHAPGHGRAMLDSHVALPVVPAIDDADLIPFRALAPTIGWMMTAHVLYRADDPHAPATLSAPIIAQTIRAAIGFSGVLISDDLAMGALAGTRLDRARACLEAGCDIALECAGDFAANRTLLEHLPDPTEATLDRLARAAALLPATPALLDADALAAEREHLLG